jgi:hypothetical protein
MKVHITKIIVKTKQKIWKENTNMKTKGNKRKKNIKMKRIVKTHKTKNKNKK